MWSSPPAKRRLRGVPVANSPLEANLWRPVAPEKKSKVMLTSEEEELLQRQVEEALMMSDYLGASSAELSGMERDSAEFREAMLGLLLDLRRKEVAMGRGGEEGQVK